MDEVLRAEYGLSIGKATHSRLFNVRVQRITQLITEREARIIGYKTPKTKREQRYNWLRERHFNRDEALRLSHLRRLQGSAGIQKMVNERAAVWNGFVRTAARRGWSSEKERRTEWRKYLARWYRRKGYVTKGVRKAPKGTPAIWVWYNKIQDALPLEDQDETPRRHKRRPQKPITPHQITRSQQKNNLRRMLRDAPEREKPRIRQWIKDIEEGAYA
tara:strand:- start:4742 stop:5392 length:651 start_codon:yes stop_codon:yes gene_type:complete